jgi:ABC-type cobalamin/Fe3+-siderophores transport system ATPase subunit
MKVFGIAGHSGMGKTTLLERLVPALSAQGLVVSLIKHSHKAIDVDRPGKDSYRLRESGCKEVLLLGNDRWALMHELRGAPEPPLDYLLDRMQHRVLHRRQVARVAALAHRLDGAAQQLARARLGQHGDEAHARRARHRAQLLVHHLHDLAFELERASRAWRRGWRP